MPSRRSGGVGTTRRKHSVGNLRRAHPASGATWNVQVVRGKMSSKCLWHACRALILGLALMMVGAGMATLGYYADHLSMGSELRGNVTVRVKNDLKGFHLNNFAYVGPIVMGFGGFIVVASCVMTFEARDSAAKVVPARLRGAGGGSCNKTTARSNQGSSASQRRGMGAQYQTTRWDQHFGVFRSSPGDPHQQLQAVAGAAGAGQQQAQPFDREALTAELINFSKSLSNSTMSDSSYSGRWTARCASVASRTSSIDSRRIQVDLHSPEVMPKSILRSPKRYSSGPSATPSVEKEFRSQLSVCSEPPPPVRQLSGQSSMEPAVPEESVELIDERVAVECHSNSECNVAYSEISELVHHTHSLPPKKQRPDFLPLGGSADQPQQQKQQQKQQQQQQEQQLQRELEREQKTTLYRSNSSRQFYRPKPAIAKDRDDSVFYIRSLERAGSAASGDDHMYDSLKVINERRSTLLKADSQSSLGSAERKLSSFSLKMPDITERENSIDIEDGPPITQSTEELEKNPNET
ncbi:ras-interacting protein RIP3 isoform X3 [Drosophila montana]|uniref:ras-interacting protein RIP3 isoform X3 n=1 Tax=Drosophila montana TaxID=40370 RepID=UPI00313E9A21